MEKIECTFYAAGICRAGTKCKYLHKTINKNVNKNKSENKINVFNNENNNIVPLPCRFFMEGYCKAGLNCKFSHKKDLKIPKPGSILIPCKYYINGFCNQAKMCLFLHPPKDKIEINSSNNQNKSKNETKFSEIIEKESNLAVFNNLENNNIISKDISIDIKHLNNNKCSCKMVNTSIKELTVESMNNNLNNMNLTECTCNAMIDKNVEIEQMKNVNNVNNVNEINEEEIEQKDEFIWELDDNNDVYFYGDNIENNEIANTNRIKSMYRYYVNTPVFLYKDIALKNIKDSVKKLDNNSTDLYHNNNNQMYNNNKGTSLDKDELIEIEKEINLSKNAECNICYDITVNNNQRFGILTGCNHVFCLDCIRNWRGKSDQPKDNIRQCPVCRKETFFIIPSNRIIIDPMRKENLIKTYQDNLRKIPCRYFNEGRGSCPFGTSCFYIHRYKDGTLDDRKIRTAVDSEGKYDILKEVRLDQFIKNSI